MIGAAMSRVWEDNGELPSHRPAFLEEDSGLNDQEPPIRIWLARIGSDSTPERGELELLSPDERMRASRYHFREHRDAFIRSRMLFRTLVGKTIGISACAVRFSYSGMGKPIVSSDPTLHVNIAHSASLFACAITRLGPIGIDVEEIRPLPDLDAIASTFFAPEEQAQLRFEGDRCDAFYRCWTRKEAFIKATGAGLSTDLQSFAVSITEDRLIRLPEPTADLSAWTLKSFQPARSFAGAWAIRASGAWASVAFLEEAL